MTSFGIPTLKPIFKALPQFFRRLTLFACVVAVFPLAPAFGLSQRAVVEAESEEAPAESDTEGSPSEATLSTFQHSHHLGRGNLIRHNVHRGGQRGLNALPVGAILGGFAFHRTRRYLPLSGCDQECFCLPLRC